MHRRSAQILARRIAPARVYAWIAWVLAHGIENRAGYLFRVLSIDADPPVDRETQRRVWLAEDAQRMAAARAAPIDRERSQAALAEVRAALPWYRPPSAATPHGLRCLCADCGATRAGRFRS